MSTPRLLDAILWRVLGVPLPRNPSIKKAPRTKTRKTNQDGSIEFVDEIPPAQEKKAPTMTYGSMELSAKIYNTPLLTYSKEQIEEFEKERAKQAEEAEKQRQADIKTYQTNYEADAAAYRQDFGRQIGGIGLLSSAQREEIERREAEEKAREQKEKARIENELKGILKNASGKTSGIKTYPHAYD